MKTKQHWEQCKYLESYKAANQVGLQLKEYAKKHGFDPRGIHILSKENVHSMGRTADAMVLWCEGPEKWSQTLGFKQFGGVHVEPHDGHSLSFYDIYLPTNLGDQYD